MCVYVWASQVISGKESTCQCRSSRRRARSLSREDPLEEENPLKQPTPVFLPRKFHGQRSLAGYSPWCCKESDKHEHAYKSLLVFFPSTDRQLLDSIDPVHLHILRYSVNESKNPSIHYLYTIHPLDFRDKVVWNRLLESSMNQNRLAKHITSKATPKSGAPQNPGNHASVCKWNPLSTFTVTSWLL